MKVRIQFLRQADAFKDRLRQDGWELLPETPDTLSIWHPLVSNEDAARERLHNLRILTSPMLRIDFTRPDPGELTIPHLPKRSRRTAHVRR